MTARQQQQQQQQQDEDDDDFESNQHPPVENVTVRKRKAKSRKRAEPVNNKKGRRDIGETIEEPAVVDDSGFQITLGESIYEDFDDVK